MNNTKSDFQARRHLARQDRLQAERAAIPLPQVIEDDPDTAWQLWQQAIAAQDEPAGNQRN